MKAIAVYCASSSRIPAAFLEAGREVGRLIARAGCEVVCGGGRTGLMGAVIDGALEEGGRAVGVLPAFMIERGWHHDGLSERIVTEGMHERKAAMLRRADAIIALPGGIGTFDELFEAMTWRQLNLYRGRIVILDQDGYYGPLLEQLRRAIDLRFMNPGHAELVETAASPGEAVAKALVPDNHPSFDQKIR